MKKTGLVLMLVTIGSLIGAAAFAAGETGRIEGRITVEGGKGHGGIVITVRELERATISDANGVYSFSGVPAGSYTLAFQHGAETETRSDVVVVADSTVVVDVVADWELTLTETLTVYSASRKRERIVEAPAAVTVVGEEEIAREASHGQLPKLLEFTPGAGVTQSGVYDYNFNTRGFNSSLNRRVATLIDGRDPSVPFLGAQEWSSLSFPLDDLATAEMVRGPSAALYGANASSGVLNLTTKQPRFSQGGMVRLTAGELETTNADFRYATDLGKGWYLKANAGIRDTGDYAVSRKNAAEYSVPCETTDDIDCLPQERARIDPLDENDVLFGALRFDKYMADGGGVLTIEGGTSDVEGPVFQTGIGRVQLIDVQRPWARGNYSMDHWNFLAYWSGRRADEQTQLAGGANLALDSDKYSGEVQTNWDFARGKARIVAGASYTRDEIDSKDPDTGLQTLMSRPVDPDSRAVYAQADWQASEKIKLVLAGRWDGSSLHDSQFSPKGSIVYNVTPAHTLRFTYNEAFQVANYSEFFLNAPARAKPADLSDFELLCLLNGVPDCGLAGSTLGGEGTPVRALGNDDLEVEEIETFEIGYSGIFGGKAFLTVDYYNSDNENFITDLLPNVGTPLGRINPDFGPWAGSTTAETTPVTVIDLDGDTIPDIPPIFLGVPVAETIRQLCALSTDCGGWLSNDVDGSNIIAARSYTNFGEVDTQGVDVGLNWFFDEHWNAFLTYSWFDFDLKGDTAGLEDQLLPNSPEHKYSVGGAYVGKRWDASLSFRWVDEFRWVVGPFQGQVEEYTSLDAVGNFKINDRWTAGANIANLLNDEHWEAFGGDLLERRALAHITYGWK